MRLSDSAPFLRRWQRHGQDGYGPGQQVIAAVWGHAEETGKLRRRPPARA